MVLMLEWIKSLFKKESKENKEVDPLVVEALSWSKAKLDRDPSKAKMDKATQNKELMEWAIHFMNDVDNKEK